MTGSSGADGQRDFALYGGLVVYDPEQNQTVHVLAESFEPNADYTVWTLKLQPDMVFSDGTPFNAEAVRVGSAPRTSPIDRHRSRRYCRSRR